MRITEEVRNLVNTIPQESKKNEILRSLSKMLTQCCQFNYAISVANALTSTPMANETFRLISGKLAEDEQIDSAIRVARSITRAPV